jgi:death-on-curing protein
MDEIRQLSVAEVIAAHARILERSGAANPGLRDEGLLEAAVNRGRMAAYYEGADLFEQAVLVAVGISQSQPFVDGNKRAAFAYLVIFLRINGWFLPGNGMDIAERLVAIAEAGSADRPDVTAQLAVYLRAVTTPL